jgi:hypothetical protein
MPLLDPLLPLAPVIDPIFDPLTLRFGRALRAYVHGPPMRSRHAATRERALRAVVETWRRRVDEVIDGVRARDANAIDRYDSLVAQALEELRGEGEARVASSASERAAHAIDRALYVNRPEWLDDPSFDAALRVRALDRLDRMNETLGNYDSFLSAVAPLVDRARAAGVERPTIVDLASGHAMFAVLMALHFGAREGRVRVVATDLLPEYLELGRAQAKRLGLRTGAMDFVVQDALDLRDLESKIGARADVVCCTQSVHHFPPGMVARMFAEATAAARHGALVIDGERNPFALLLVAIVGSIVGRGSLPFMHDALVSMRRMYTEQELALIAALSPARDRIAVRRGWLPPGHVWIEGALRSSD